MGVYLGNVSISELERRTGYNFSEEDRKWLESHRQDDADVKFDSEKFHIFDIPFEIHVTQSINDYLTKLLLKYENISSSKEPLRLAKITETEEHKQKRLEKEQKEKEAKERKENPNSVWNIKWDMLVPVTVVDVNTKNTYDCYYWCFLNTYTTGKNNIPDMIDGNAWIMLDDRGLHGQFKLDNPERDNDANKHTDWNWVIGCGFYNLHGRWIGSINDVIFEKVSFSIKEAINRFINITDKDYFKEISYHS